MSRLGQENPGRASRGVVAYVLAIAALLVVVAGWTALKGTRVEAFRLPAASMAPSWLAGDYIMTKSIDHPPARGQVVVYRTPAATFLKRVVAVPGDTVAMSEGQLSINGVAASEPYARSGDIYDQHPDNHDSTEFSWQDRYLVAGVNAASYHPTMHNWGPLVVPDSDYFVLGDNRDESLDSRYTGFVPAAAIVARPLFIYLSWDAERRSMRWNRIGLEPR